MKNSIRQWLFYSVMVGVSLQGVEASENSSINKLSAGAPVESKYMLFCGGCHGVDGKGEVEADVPRLSPFVGSFLHDTQGAYYLVNVGGMMSAGINAQDAADITNYILQTFGRETLPDSFSPLSAEDIAMLRSSPPDDLVALRRDIAARLAEDNIAIPSHYPWK